MNIPSFEIFVACGVHFTLSCKLLRALFLIFTISEYILIIKTRVFHSHSTRCFRHKQINSYQNHADAEAFSHPPPFIS